MNNTETMKHERRNEYKYELGSEVRNVHRPSNIGDL